MNLGAGNEQARREELSGRQTRLTNEELSLRRGSLIEEYIADRRQYRRFRYYAFFGMAGLIAMLVTLFAIWIRSFALRVFGESLQRDQPEPILLLTPLVIIASLVAVSLLPIVRLVFREAGGKEDDKDGLTLWQTLIKELADLLKQYLTRSKPAA